MGLAELQKIKEMANEPKKRNFYQIPKVSAKKKIQMEAQKIVFAKDMEFYKSVWSTVPHICFNCGCKLPKDFKPYHFHHLLPKSKFEALRHVKSNIVTLCLECHSKAEVNMDFAPKIREKTNEVRKLLLGE